MMLKKQYITQTSKVCGSLLVLCDLTLDRRDLSNPIIGYEKAYVAI